MRQLVLFVSILGLLVAGRTANAAVVATFEGPASGPVAGIGVIRGWAFDKSGGGISKVEVYIDDVYLGDAPCCSERGDVANAFGPQALKSGWGLTFNWGNLPAGLHTIHVIVRSTGAVWTSDKRPIDVVKPGGFAFLSDYDLSEATVRIDPVTEEIILDNVYVVDKATGQRTQVNGIRYQWLPEIQNPQIVGPQASKVTFEFGADVSAADQELIRKVVYRTAEFLQSKGVPITRPLMVSTKNVGGSRAIEYTAYICTSCPDWANKPEILKVNMIAHEFGHIAIQGQWIAWPKPVGTVPEAAWLIEGPACLLGYSIMELFGGATLEQQIELGVRIRASGTGGQNLRNMETYQGWDGELDTAIMAAYDLGGGSYNKLSTFWRYGIASGMHWKDAFAKYLNGGKSLEDFYATYVVN